MFVPLNGGLNTRKDPRQLAPGELTQAAGVEHRPGSQSVFTTGSRAIDKIFGTDSLIDLLIAQYDAGASVVVGAVGTSIYEKLLTVGGAGTLAQLEGADLAFASQPAALMGAMFNDRLYAFAGVPLSIGGIDKQFNIVRLSDGTYRRLGMDKPSARPTVTNNTGEAASAASYKPTSAADSGGWINVNNVADASETTAATSRLSAPGTAVFTWTFASQAISGHTLYVKHGGSALPSSESGREVGVGGSGRESVTAHLKIEITQNSGTDWTTLVDRAIPYQEVWASIALTASNLSTVQVRATHTFTSGSSPSDAIIDDIQSANANANTFTTSAGFRYILSEFSRTYGIESDYSEESELITLTAHNRVPVTLPATAVNAITTHLRLYRSTDGSLKGEFDKYTLIDEIPVGTATYYDIFTVGFTTVGTPTLPIIPIGQGDSATFYPRNTKPPLYKSACFYQSSLVGVPVDDNSAKEGIICYSHPFLFDYRPALYNIPTRSPRNDTPVAVYALDTLLMVGFGQWTKRIRGLPYAVAGTFDVSQPDDASTHRGVAGPNAVDTFSFPNGDGRVYAACADYAGVYITDGYTFTNWSDNIVWGPQKYLGTDGIVNLTYLSQTVVRNNPKKQRIEVHYVPTGGSSVTRRIDFYYGEMREDGQPRISGPHMLVARAATYAWVPTLSDWVSWTGGANGNVYIEDFGNTDASQSYDSSGSVQRVIQTGNIAPYGFGRLARIKRYALRYVIGAYESITHYLASKLPGAETLIGPPLTEDPQLPTPVLVSTAGESFYLHLDDTGLREKAELLGAEVDVVPLGDERSALRASLGSTPGSSNLPV